ncbi:MAG: hypothetical protein ABIJ45_06640, partial [Candidatus Zixiibacteriota bacterium]
ARKPIIVLNPFIDDNKTPLNLNYFDYYKPSLKKTHLVPIKNGRTDSNKWLETWPFKSIYKNT